jgi:HPt (histidine-containing phosphotransfer) domain-containing protein
MVSSGNGRLLDLETALSRVGGDSELLSEIATLFLSDYPNQVSALTEAIAHRDAGGVEKAAHTLKGSVATFGATPAVESALGLERAGRANDLSGAPQMLTDLIALLAALHAELERL